MPGLSFDEWYRRIEPEIGNTEKTPDGQPRFPHLIYENAFALNVLARIDDLDFACVFYQRNIEIAGQRYRIDFTIEEPGGVPIAIEVDGTNKYDGGTRSRSPAEHRNELDREHALQGEGFLVFHFANTQVRDHADECRARLVKFIDQARRSNRNHDALDDIQDDLRREDYEGMKRRLAQLEGRENRGSEEHQETLQRIADLERLLKEERAPARQPAPQSRHPRQLAVVGGAIAAIVVAIIGFTVLRTSADPARAARCDDAEPIPSDPQVLAGRAGDRLDLRGTFVNFRQVGESTYLNLNARHREPGHFAFVIVSNREWATENKSWLKEGQEIAATGSVGIGDKGQPQLRISNPSSINRCD